MAVKLETASPRQGVAWASRGFALFTRHPLGFSALFFSFLVAALLAVAIPYAGALLVIAALPLLTLGFMVAARAAEAGEPVHVGHLFEPLRTGDAPRRRALAGLCLAYAAATALLMLGADRIDEGDFHRLQILLAGARSEAGNREIDELLGRPRFMNAMLLRLVGSAAISVPFWHAPALAWWQGQGVAQSLFSSTVACWHNKGAFLVYGLAWLMTSTAAIAVAAAGFALIGAPQLAGVAAAPALLIFSVAFYASLYATYRGCFSEAG